MAKGRRLKMTAVKEVRLCDVSGWFPRLGPQDMFRYRVFQWHVSAVVAIPFGPDSRRRHRLVTRVLIRLTNIQDWNILERSFDRALKAVSEFERRQRRSDRMIAIILGRPPEL